MSKQLEERGFPSRATVGHGKKTRGLLRTALAGAVWLAAGFAQAASPADPARASITAADLLRHTRVLSSNEFEGRAPASRGEELTVGYLVEQFRKLGLKPGHPDGTFIQKVPLIGLTAQDVSIAWSVGSQRTALAFPGESVVWTKRFAPETKVTDSEMVFVGYGVVAPEYGWDDFKGVDVRGKTIVMLINDPAVPDPGDPSKLDEKIFKGRAMTYYGRWTYKYEIAAERGAAAALIVHETGPAGYPYTVVLGSNSRENFDLQAPDKNLGRAAVEGWITEPKAREFFTACGQDFDSLKRAAVRRDFQPVALSARASFSFKTALREVASQNVVARLDGSDPQRRDEFVIYTAHWDHLGRNPKLEGDAIFNGAMDNASGLASLLELAEAFTRRAPAPKRSLLFLSVTAEEKGLLGAKFYATQPLYPLAKTLANLNMDSMNPWGRTRDVNVIGIGQNTLEDVLGPAIARQGRVMTPDDQPEKGRYYRSDHFEFAKVGVPALYLKGGVDYLGKPAAWGQQRFDGYTANDYHKVSDEIQADWDLTGAAEDTQLLFDTGLAVANGPRWPEWKAGSEFKARRDAVLQGRK